MENSILSVAAARSLSLYNPLFVRSLPTGSRLWLAAQLLHFRLHARVFDDLADIESDVLRLVRSARSEFAAALLAGTAAVPAHPIFCLT